jgi:hypothetical protein
VPDTTVSLPFSFPTKFSIIFFHCCMAPHWVLSRCRVCDSPKTFCVSTRGNQVSCVSRSAPTHNRVTSWISSTFIPDDSHSSSDVRPSPVPKVIRTQLCTYATSAWPLPLYASWYSSDTCNSGASPAIESRHGSNSCAVLLHVSATWLVPQACGTHARGVSSSGKISNGNAAYDIPCEE